MLNNFENNLQIVINQLIRILHLVGKVKSVNVKGNLTKWIYKSSRSKVFLGKGVLKICRKFTGEHPCQSVMSIKLLSNYSNLILRFVYITFSLLTEPQTMLQLKILLAYTLFYCKVSSELVHCVYSLLICVSSFI